MNKLASSFAGVVTLIFLLAPIGGVRADENPIGILLAAGDIVTCPPKDTKADDIKTGKATADLIAAEIAAAEKSDPKIQVRVLALGDLAYDHGETFDCFNATWGQFKDKILPVPGNHDYEKNHGAAYFKYFETTLQGLNASKLSVYSLEFPTASMSSENTSWQIIALNSNDETGAAQPQVKWLEAELKRTKAKRCVLAFSHGFFYSSGRHGHADKNGKPQNAVIDITKPLLAGKEMHAMFTLLHSHRASVLVAGHDHHFEQLGRANAEAKPADKGQAAMVDDGVRSFVVGTGGKRLYPDVYREKWAFTEAFDMNNHGILKMKLYPNSYSWEFISTKPTAPSMTVIRDVKKDNCNRT